MRIVMKVDTTFGYKKLKIGQEYDIEDTLAQRWIARKLAEPAQEEEKEEPLKEPPACEKTEPYVEPPEEAPPDPPEKKRK